MVFNISNKGITQIVCGWNHTLIFVEPYYVYAAGLSKYGELGLRDFEMRRSFTLIEDLAGKNVVEIFAGGYHSWFLFQYDEPDIDYEPPSPLLTTPVHSINEEEPVQRRPKSHDSDNPRRKKFTLEERNEVNEKRNINIRNDDDLKKFEELLKGPRFNFGPETQNEDADNFKQGRRTFDVLNPPVQSTKKTKTPVVRSPYTEQVDRGKKFNNIYMQTTDFGSKFGIQDNYNKQQIQLTPRSKFHQNVDEDPEMIIPGYQPISDDDNTNKQLTPKSPIKDVNRPQTGDGGNFNFKGIKNPIPPIEISDDENPPSINESDQTPSQKSYEQYEHEEHVEEHEDYYHEGDEQDPSDDSNRDPWIKQPYKPQQNRPTFDPPSKNIAIKPPRFNTEDDVSDSHDNYKNFKDRDKDDNRRNTTNVPVQQPRQNQRRYQPQLTDDFGSDGELNPNDQNSEQDEYAKLSRKMQNMLDKSKSDRSRKDNYRSDLGEKPDDRDAFKKQRANKEVFQPSHSEDEDDNDKYVGRPKSNWPEDDAQNKNSRGGRGSESQGLYKSGPGEEFRGSFSQKPSKSDQFYDDFDQKNKNQRPKRKTPVRIKEHEEEDEDSVHSIEEDDYRAVKDTRRKDNNRRDKKNNKDIGRKNDNRDGELNKNFDRQDSKGPKGYSSNDQGDRNISRYEAPADNNAGYNRRGEEIRKERNIFVIDFRLFFVDLKYCHRFAIMTCHAKDNQRVKSSVEEILADLKQNDPQIQVSNFLPIEEFYEKDKSNFLTALGIVPSHGVTSYVLMMVSLPESYVNFQRQNRLVKTNYKEYKAAQSSIGPSFELSEAQIIDDARLKMLSSWYLMLKSRLWNKTTSLRFLELRPSMYK